MGRFLAAAIIVALCSACQREPEAGPSGALKQSPSPMPIGSSQSEFRDAALAMGPGDCKDLFRIKAAPHKSAYLGADPYWDRIVVHAQHYRPCLVEAVTDRNPVQGILFGPGNPAHTVGDVAHALLVEAGFVEWGICVPPAVSGSPYGAVAVRDWLGQSGNRTAWESCLRRELEPN